MAATAGSKITKITGKDHDSMIFLCDWTLLIMSKIIQSYPNRSTSRRSEISVLDLVSGKFNLETAKLKLLKSQICSALGFNVAKEAFGLTCFRSPDSVLSMITHLTFPTMTALGIKSQVSGVIMKA